MAEPDRPGHDAEVAVFADADALADAAAALVATCAAEAIAARGRFLIALSGGSTPRALHERLASDAWRTRIDWSKVHVVWGDERTVPPDHADSNYGMAKASLLDHVPVPAGQVHRMRGEDDPVAAAADYETTLRALVGDHPGLDLVLLGLGADGHTASLFPQRPTLREGERWVVADEVDGRGTWRITLTAAAINTAAAVAFVVGGDGKAGAVRDVIEGPRRPRHLPAQLIDPAGRLVWLLDAAAASRLDGDRFPKRVSS